MTPTPWAHQTVQVGGHGVWVVRGCGGWSARPVGPVDQTPAVCAPPPESGTPTQLTALSAIEDCLLFSEMGVLDAVRRGDWSCMCL